MILKGQNCIQSSDICCVLDTNCWTGTSLELFSWPTQRTESRDQMQICSILRSRYVQIGIQICSGPRYRLFPKIQTSLRQRSRYVQTLDLDMFKPQIQIGSTTQISIVQYQDLDILRDQMFFARFTCIPGFRISRFTPLLSPEHAQWGPNPYSTSKRFSF